MTDNSCTTSQALDDLAQQLLNQRVVFFVGAGFSRDSEGITTEKIMATLLCRFLAMTDVNEFKELGDNKELSFLRSTCKQLFSLDIKECELKKNESWYRLELIKIFASKYYQFNEWMVRSFNVLYHYHNSSKKFSKINNCEKQIREAFVNHIDKLDIDDVLLPCNELCWNLLECVEPKKDGEESKHGKVIFIETVGLGNPEVMVSHQSDNYQSLPRYQVFGKLAREGLLPIMLTTNYDLLLEQGYSEVGLNFGKSLEQSHLTHLPVQAQLIKQPMDFFQNVAVANPAHIVKIHGCAQQYRDYKEALTKNDDKATAKKQFNDYLDSIVYTYREIQHWRDDAWSRDYLQTLLRTRTFVFCGYSGADPVMHHTVRSIYEEIGRKTTEKSSNTTLAYSTSGRGSPEFDTLEILNSASLAAGGEPEFHRHKNYLEFQFQADSYPCCDVVFRHLLHRTLRKLQCQLLKSQLTQMTLSLFGKYKPASEIESIITSFEVLLKQETEFKLHGDAPNEKYQLEHQLVWTECFHQRLLWLYMQANNWQQSKFNGLFGTKPGVYIPLRENPVWSCWGIVLELAIRAAYEKMAKKNNQTDAETENDRIGYQLPLADDPACLYISINKQGPVGLTLSSPSLSHFTAKKVVCSQNNKIWDFDPSIGLWPKADDEEKVSDNKEEANKVDVISQVPPLAADIWRLACGQTIKSKSQKLEGYFAYVS